MPEFFINMNWLVLCPSTHPHPGELNLEFLCGAMTILHLSFCPKEYGDRTCHPSHFPSTQHIPSQNAGCQGEWSCGNHLPGHLEWHIPRLQSVQVFILLKFGLSMSFFWQEKIFHDTAITTEWKLFNKVFEILSDVTSISLPSLVNPLYALPCLPKL